MTDASAAPPQPIERKYVGSASIHEYDIDQKLGEGTFGEVYKARSHKTGKIIALKKILMHNEKDGFPITALREIKLLKMLSHKNVIALEEMAVERTKEKKKATLYMVFPYMQHDLSGLLDNKDVRLTIPIIKCYMLQLLEGLLYLHASNILHRDMKAANLLIDNRGILKIADFGLARHYDEPVPRPGRGNGEAHRDYTTLVVTRWYRPPELLLQLRRYTPAIDMWGAGCVFGEMFKRKPILSGKSDINQAEIIFELVGSPNEQNMPGWKDLPGCEGVRQWDKRPGNLRQVFRDIGSDAISLLEELLTLDWRKRINAHDAMQHPYFTNEPLPALPHEIPQFMDSHELDRRNGRGAHQELPPAPPGGTVGGGPNDWNGPVNGDAWANGARPSRYPAAGGPPPGRSRVPQGAYDNRHPPPYDHRPPMDHDRRRDIPRYGEAPASRGAQHLQMPPDGLRHALPPRPDGLPPRPDMSRAPQRDHRDRDRESGRRQPAKQGANVDTYIPQYSANDAPRRDPRRSMERDGRHSMERDDRYSRPTSHGDDRASRLDYDEPGGRPAQRRTRSRSPDRSRHQHHDRRERDHRDVYRR